MVQEALDPRDGMNEAMHHIAFAMCSTLHTLKGRSLPNKFKDKKHCDQSEGTKCRLDIKMLFLAPLYAP